MELFISQSSTPRVKVGKLKWSIDYKLSLFFLLATEAHIQLHTLMFFLGTTEEKWRVVIQTFVLHHSETAVDGASLRYFREVYKIRSSHVFAWRGS